MRPIPRKVQRWLGLLALVAVALPMTGCKKKAQSASTPVSVKGRVLDADGKPLTRLLLVFHPQDSANPPRRAAINEGHFETKCLPGRYKVTLAAIPAGGQAPTGGGVLADPSKGDQSLPEGIPVRYQHEGSSPWAVTIPEGGKEDLELHVEHDG